MIPNPINSAKSNVVVVAVVAVLCIALIAALWWVIPAALIAWLVFRIYRHLAGGP